MELEDTPAKLDEEILESEAIPEVKLKWYIFDTVNKLQVVKQRIIKNRLVANSIDRNQKGELAGYICSLFDYIKYMTLQRMNELEQSSKHKEEIREDREIFEKIEKMQRGRSFSVETMLEMVDFLLRYLHLLKITNLLRTEEDAIESFKKSYS